jgi:hypothetical protein
LSLRLNKLKEVIMKNKLVKGLVGSAVVFSCLAAGSIPAYASVRHPNVSPTASSAALEKLQASAVTAIAKREAALTKETGKVNANTYLTNSDKASVLSRINLASTGLTALGQKIAADTDVATAKTDVQSIFTTYRVFAVVIPSAAYATAADDLTGKALPALTKSYTSLNNLLKTKDKAKDTPALDADLADMQAKTNMASSNVDGVASTALAVTPDDWNSNKSIFSGIHTQLGSARSEVKSAVADGKAILAALHG